MSQNICNVSSWFPTHSPFTGPLYSPLRGYRSLLLMVHTSTLLHNMTVGEWELIHPETHRRETSLPTGLLHRQWLTQQALTVYPPRLWARPLWCGSCCRLWVSVDLSWTMCWPSYSLGPSYFSHSLKSFSWDHSVNKSLSQESQSQLDDLKR